MLQFTGERYVPWAAGVYEGAYEHYHRYGFAAPLMRGKKVLDLACGEGYGSALLAEYADHVLGLDVDPQAVHHAASRYTQPNLEFLVGSMTHVPLTEPGQFDVITCFEAFEHITRQDLLLSEVKRLLKPDGFFIVSTPNRLVFTDQTGIKNPFHLKELYRDEFEQLVGRTFAHSAFLAQRVLSTSHIWSLQRPGQAAQETLRPQEFYIKKAHDEFMWAKASSRQAKFFIAVCSDGPLPSFSGGSSLVDIDDMRYANEVQQKEQAYAYQHVLEKKRDEYKTALEQRGREVQELRGERTVLLERNDAVSALESELTRTRAVLDEYRAALDRMRGSRAFALYSALKKVRRVFRGK